MNKILEKAIIKKYPKERKEVINLKKEMLEKTMLFCYASKILPNEIKEIIIRDFQKVYRQKIVKINKKVHIKKFRFCTSQIRVEVMLIDAGIWSAICYRKHQDSVRSPARWRRSRKEYVPSDRKEKLKIEKSLQYEQKVRDAISIQKSLVDLDIKN